MKNIHYILLLIVLMASCKTLEESTSTTESTEVSATNTATESTSTSAVSDSVRIEKEYITVYTDTTIVVQGDSATRTIVNPCDTNGLLRDFILEARGERQAGVSIKARGDRLEVTCECRDERATISKYKQEVKELNSISRATESTLTQRFDSLQSEYNSLVSTSKTKTVKRFIPWYSRPFFLLIWLAIALSIGVVIGQLGLHIKLFNLLKLIV